MDTGLKRRLEAALKDSGFCLATLGRTEHAITITTPFIMPDGDHSDFHVVPKADGGWVITDFGDTAGLCLFIRGHVGAIPCPYITEIDRVLKEYGAWHPVSFTQSTLRLETPDGKLPDALRHFAQIQLHVAHICSFGAETELNLDA